MIAAIKSSLDRPPPQLSIIIKPRDLSRIDPTTQESPTKTLSDPASLLRESIKQLKKVGVAGRQFALHCISVKVYCYYERIDLFLVNKFFFL